MGKRLGASFSLGGAGEGVGGTYRTLHSVMSLLISAPLFRMSVWALLWCGVVWCGVV